MKIRKSLSLLLVLLMIMSTAPMYVLADTESTTAVYTDENAALGNSTDVTEESQEDGTPGSTDVAEDGQEGEMPTGTDVTEDGQEGETPAGTDVTEDGQEGETPADTDVTEDGQEGETPAGTDVAEDGQEGETPAGTDVTEDGQEDVTEADEQSPEEDEAASDADGEDNKEEKAVRTIMFYVCGSNLETYSAMATYNIKQILGSNFSKDDKVKFVIMTGGSDEWHTPSELLVDPAHPGETVDIDPEYNQVWEAKGKDAAENPGKMVLLEEKGLHNIKARDKSDEEYSGEVMSDPDLLKDFIDYCVDRYPAEKYDLILWDHGSGPLGGFANDEATFFGEMSFPQMMDAFSNNAVTKDGGKFDFINFDACLMGSAELAIVFADYTDYYIASPENIPGYGEYYTGWLNTLGKDPEYDTYKLGKQIVDDYIAFYEDDSDERTSGEGTLAVIDMNKLAHYYGFTETLQKLPYYLKQQATEPNTEVNDILFYDEFDSGKNSIRYGGDMNYYDLGTLVSQLSFDFKELTPDDVYDDGTIIDENIYTEPIAELNALLYNRKDMIYARGTRGIRSKSMYYRDIYGQTHYDTVGTSGLYLYFPVADNVDEVHSYHHILEKVIERLEKNLEQLESEAETLDPEGQESLELEIKIREAKSRIAFFREYSLALVDYALIAKTGKDVTQMLDEGYDRTSIDYDSFREYHTGGATFDPSIDDLEADENMEYTISDWCARFMDYLLLRAGMSAYASYSQHPAAEAASRDWMNEVITQQAEENISRKDMSLEDIGENGSGGKRVHMKNTQKRVVEDVRYNITAHIPAADNYLTACQEKGEFELMSDEEKEGFITANIGHVIGTPVLEREDGTPVDKDSKRDFVEWYLEPGGTWELPKIDDTWYTVRDKDGYCHVANIETDEEAGELYFYGNYKSENGIDTLCCLAFNEDGDLSEILLGTEDGNSYRRIPASELVGEVEVMPIRQGTIFVDDVSIPLSMKPIVVSPKTVNSIKLVRKDLNDIDDLKTDGKVSVRHAVVVRDIYGYEIQFDDEKEEEVTPEEPADDPEPADPEPTDDPEPAADPEPADDPEPSPSDSDAEESTITYDLNGGEYDGSTDDIIEEYPSGTVILIHEAPTREGYEFMYWKGSEYQPGDEYTVADDHTFTAQWEKSDEPAWDEEPDDDGYIDADSDTSEDSADSSKGVRTGDNSRMYIWIAASLAALLMLIGLYCYRRKQEKN